MKYKQTYKSALEDAPEGEYPETRGDKDEWAIKSIPTWTKWINYKYQSTKMDHRGSKSNGPVLDNCIACGGLGFIGGIEVMKIMGTKGKYEVAYACPCCDTGAAKREKCGEYPDYPNKKPDCIYSEQCPYESVNQIQNKCKLVNRNSCKFFKGKGSG